MRIPILSGIFTDNGPDMRQLYPVNMSTVVLPNGISEGYLRPTEGLVEIAQGPGTDRGGIEYEGICYRVMGTKLVTVNQDDSITILGDVGFGGQVTMDYSFDLLAIAADGNLFYYNPALNTLVQVTDPDIGTVLDVVWVDGYFMTTDGEFLIVTELTDPTQVNPLKYGSSEVDPDPVVGLVKTRNEIYAINRNTIEVFDNVGGEFFPFARIDGAQIQKGAVGTHAACVYLERIAFVGGGRNERVSVYLGSNSNTEKIGTREIDDILQGLTSIELDQILVETRVFRNQNLLYVHLPDRTLVFDGVASQAGGTPVWTINTTARVGFQQYRAKNFVYCYDKWIFGDPQSDAVGTFDEKTSAHWGEVVRWEFGTSIIYNESVGAVIHQLELVSLTGRVALGENPTISTSYSYDGQKYSQEKFINVGSVGDTTKRLVWFQQGFMRNWRTQRFRGTSDAHITVARLEAQVEPMSA
jgi:hypothetical protein